MTDKRVPLAVAAFMDSAHAVHLAAPDTAGIRTIVERLVECCLADLARPPEELDGEALRELLGGMLPTRFDPEDPLAPHVADVVPAFFEHLEETAVLSHSFELKMALEPGLEAFAAGMVERTGGRRRSARETGTVTNKVARTGRNDPCPCGSGLKFKRCCGK